MLWYLFTRIREIFKIVSKDQTYEQYYETLVKSDWVHIKERDHISENQFGFMSRRSTIKVIYLSWDLLERYQSKERLTYGIHWLKKTYDRVPRKILW